MVIKKTKNILNKRNKKSKKIKEITGGFLGIKSKLQKKIKYNIKKQLKEQGNTGEKYNSKKYNPIISKVKNYFKLQKKTLKSKPNSQNISKVVKSFMNAYTGPQTEKKSRHTNSSGYINIGGPNKPSNNSNYLTIEPATRHSTIQDPIVGKRKAPPSPNGRKQTMGPDGNLITIRRSNNEYAKLIPQVFNPEYVVYNPKQNNTNPYTELGPDPNIPLKLVINQNKLNQLSNNQLKKYLQNDKRNLMGRLVVTANQRSQISNILTQRKYSNASNATLNRALKNTAKNSLGQLVMSDKEKYVIKQIKAFSKQRIANQISQVNPEEPLYAYV
jgi:hypothetical protein